MFTTTSSRKGITLVELLVVLALVGILAKVGLPAYGRMVQKARKAEIKNHLAAVYKIERVFQAEYSTYGNNLLKMGLEVPNQQFVNTLALYIHAGRYNFGFNDGRADCAVMNQNIFPPLASASGVDLTNRFPAYFDTTDGRSMTWLMSSLPYNCCPSSVITNNTFTAMGSGLLSNNQDLNNAWYEDCMYGDMWTMNHDRELVNVQDGVQ